MLTDTTESTGCSLVVRDDTVPRVPQLSRLDQAYNASQPELHALPKNKLAVVNLDVYQAVCVALGATQHLQSYRARIVEELPRFDVRNLDELKRYAWTLASAHVRYMITRKDPSDIRELAKGAKRTYRILVAEARTLAERGLLPANPLKRVAGKRRALSQSFALTAIVCVLRTAWPKIEGRTGVTLAELDAAEAQADTLLMAFAARNRPVEELTRVAEDRQRAFTLFVTAYSEVRRAIQYLCREPREVERVLPSLYPRRRKHRASKNVTT
jgi:hypothetical protein